MTQGKTEKQIIVEAFVAELKELCDKHQVSLYGDEVGAVSIDTSSASDIHLRFDDWCNDFYITNYAPPNTKLVDAAKSYRDRCKEENK